MKSYKKIRLIKEADADEYVPEVDDVDDIADGEQEFVDLHTAMTLAHPVAGDNQFKSDKDSVEQKGATTDNADGEDKPVKSGTTGDTKFAQFRDKIGKTPARKGDKSQGDMKAGTVKEEVELQEKPADFIRLTFNSPADVKKAKKWMDQNLPGANQGFTSMDASGKDIEFEDVDDAEDLMAKLKKAGFKFKVDYREELVKEGTLELVDGEVVDVSNDDADVFNIVLEDLTEENRDLMLIRMHEGVDSYEQMLSFAREYA